MARYVAFLRGINLGKRRIKMVDLRAAFESWGYSKVKTLQASGNVIFTSKSDDSLIVRGEIEADLKAAFGFDIHVILRSAEEIQTLVASDPFQGIKITKDIRLYITFLSEPVKHELSLPYSSPDGNYRILTLTPSHVVSVLTLIPGSGSTAAMNILDKQFGADITTRNWNTVRKIHDLMINP